MFHAARYDRGRLEFKRFRADHFKALVLQDSQAFFQPVVDDPAYARGLEGAGPAWSCFEGDLCIGCGGIVEQWRGRGVAWALFSPLATGAKFLTIHRATKDALELSTFHRIEAYVQEDFPQGHQWAKMLGFEAESVMKKFTAEGKDSTMYVRVR